MPSKIFVVSERVRLNFGCFEFNSIHHASSWQGVLDFLQKAVDDPNSGIEHDSIIDVVEETVDAYFEGMTWLARKAAHEYIGGTYES